MRKSKPYRKEKLQDRVLHDVNTFLRSSTQDSRLKLVSVTKVELTKDCAYAKIYWDTFDVAHRGEIKKAINNVRGKVRSSLAKTLDIRHIPELEFVYDSQYESEKCITEILETEAENGKYPSSSEDELS